MNFRGEVARGSWRTTRAMPWNTEDEMAKTLGNSFTSNSVTGASYGDTETLDLKTASILMKILHGSCFRKRVLIEDEKTQQNSRFTTD